MSAPNRGVRAVVEAVDRLTTQVKRLADAQSTPVAVIRDGVMTPLDALTTTTDNAVTGCPTPLTHNWGCGCLSDPMAPVPEGPTRVHPAVYDAALRLVRRRDSMADGTDEDQQRAARREQLHNLLARLDHGGLLSTPDCTRLRVLVDTEVRAADTARAVAAGNKRHVQLLVPELEQAQAAIERVRALLDSHLGPLATAAVRRALDGAE